MSENVPNAEDAAEESAELPKVESREDLMRIIQALVFASPDIVTLKKLREILGDFLDARTVAEALIAANDSLNKIQSPFEIVEQAGGYRFRTRAKYYPWSGAWPLSMGRSVTCWTRDLFLWEPVQRLWETPTPT